MFRIETSVLSGDGKWHSTTLFELLLLQRPLVSNRWDCIIKQWTTTGFCRYKNFSIKRFTIKVMSVAVTSFIYEKNEPELIMQYTWKTVVVVLKRGAINVRFWVGELSTSVAYLPWHSVCRGNCVLSCKGSTGSSICIPVNDATPSTGIIVDKKLNTTIIVNC